MTPKMQCEWSGCHRGAEFANTFKDSKGASKRMKYCSKHKKEILLDRHLNKGSWKAIKEEPSQ